MNMHPTDMGNTWNHWPIEKNRMKILLLGNTGQLGWELNRTLLTLGELIALDYPQLNMADAKSIQMIVRETKPNIIVNATAYTNVDKAESEPELAEAINGIGPGILAEEARKLSAALIHYSTDYVFDGKKGAPYTEEDAPNPLNQYGLSKLHGEEAIQQVDGIFLVFRTSWVYSTRRPCFVTKVLEWAKKQEVLRIVDDQISNPTWARTLAEATAQVIAQGRKEPLDFLDEKSGLYHLTDGGSCSRFEWAQEIIRLSDLERDIIVEPASSEEFPSPVVRPFISILNHYKFQNTFAIVQIPYWINVLDIALS